MKYREYMRECLEIAITEGTITFTKEGFEQLYKTTSDVLEAEKQGAFVTGVAVGGLALGTIGMTIGIIMGQSNR